MTGKHIWAVGIVFVGLSLFLALNYHSHSPKFTYHSELWADAAGYYVYLPATFEHRFQADRFPPGIDTLTGRGFDLDTISNKILTKYTYGVALMQSPMYFLGKAFSQITNGSSPQSFSFIDHVMIDFSAAVYLTFGLILLFFWLSTRTSTQTAMVVCGALFFGSNLYYYSVCSPGMSHVYSFFHFSWLLWLLDQKTSERYSTLTLVGIGIACGSIILIRPLNAIFIVAGLVSSRGAIAGLTTAKAVIPISIMILLFVPQLFYWNYAHGSPFFWSYGSEGFDNWASPKLLAYLFSPQNGAILYVPLILLLFVGWYFMAKRKRWRDLLAGFGCFVMICYASSSWWSWHFGCAFGGRNLVEYMTIFSLPLAVFWDQMKASRLSWLATICLLAVTIYQLKLTYTYDGCWPHSDQDYSKFIEFMLAPTK